MTPPLQNYIDGQASGRIPKKALSIKQPWSWLIVNGWKDIENRNWLKRFPKSILVHAGRNIDDDAERLVLSGRMPCWREGNDLPQISRMLNSEIVDNYRASKAAQDVRTGGFVGMVDITGVQEDLDSPWFVGDYGYILANGKQLPFLPWRGQLGFFDVEVTERSL